MYPDRALCFVAETGLSDSLVQAIVSEIGTDMSKWPSEKQSAPWLGLAPKTIFRLAKYCAAVPYPPIIMPDKPIVKRLSP